MHPMHWFISTGADLDYMNDRKVFTGLAKMTALQRAEDIGAKKIRDFLKSKGAAAVSSSFRLNLLDGVEGGASHAIIDATVTRRRQEGNEGEAAERRLTTRVVSTPCLHTKFLESEESSIRWARRAPGARA